MGKRVGKRVREQAAMICAIAASHRTLTMYGVCTRLGISGLAPSARLAINLRFDLSEAADLRADDKYTYEHACAEAEAMLRTGWEP